MQYKKLITIMLLVTYILSLQTKDEITTTINCLAMTKSQLLQESRALSLRGHEVSEAISSENPVIASEAGQSIPPVIASEARQSILPVIASDAVARQSQNNITLRISSKFEKDTTLKIFQYIEQKPNFLKDIEKFTRVLRFIIENIEHLNIAIIFSVIELGLMFSVLDIKLVDDNVLTFFHITEGNKILQYNFLIMPDTNKCVLLNKVNVNLDEIFENDNQETIRNFINRKEVINTVDESGYSPLYLILKYDRVDLLNLIIKNGFNPNSLIITGQDVMCLQTLAINLNALDCARYLISRNLGNEIRQQGYFPIEMAVLKANIDLVIYLQYYDPGKNSYLSILLASLDNEETYAFANYLRGFREARVQLLQEAQRQETQKDQFVAKLLDMELYLEFRENPDGIEKMINELIELGKQILSAEERESNEFDYVYNYFRLRLIKLYFYNREYEKALEIAGDVFNRSFLAEYAPYEILRAIFSAYYLRVSRVKELGLMLFGTNLFFIRSFAHFQAELFKFGAHTLHFIDVEIETVYRDADERLNDSLSARFAEIKTIRDKQEKLEALKNLLTELERGKGIVVDLLKKEEIENLIRELEQERDVIIQAIIDNQVSQAQSFLNQTNINFKDEKGVPLFVLAVIHCPDLINYYIQLGYDIYQENDEDQNIIDYLLENYYDQDAQIFYTALNRIIECGWNFSGEGRELGKLLHIACYREDKTLIEILLAVPGIAINYRLPDGTTPMQIAASKGNLQIVQLLLSNGGDVNNVSFDGRTVLSGAVGHMHLSVLREIVKYNPDDSLTELWRNILFKMFREIKDEQDIAEQDLEEDTDDGNASYDDIMKELFRYFVMQKKYDFIEYMMHCENEYFSKLLDSLLLDENIREQVLLVCNHLIERGLYNIRKVRLEEGSLLFHALVLGDYELVDFLLKNGISVLQMILVDLDTKVDDISFRDLYKRLTTLLQRLGISSKETNLVLMIFTIDYIHIYCQDQSRTYNFFDFILNVFGFHMLEYNRQCEKPTSNYAIELYKYATIYGRERIGLEFLKIIDVTEDSLLHFAARVGDITFLHWLLGIKNIDVNTVDSTGKTVLNQAIDSYIEHRNDPEEKGKYSEILKYLIDIGAISFKFRRQIPQAKFGSLLDFITGFMIEDKNRDYVLAFPNSEHNLRFNITQTEKTSLEILDKLLTNHREKFNRIINERYLYEKLHRHNVYNFTEIELIYFLPNYAQYKSKILSLIEYLSVVQINSREGLQRVKHLLDDLNELLELNTSVGQIIKHFPNILRQIHQRKILNISISREAEFITERVCFSNGFEFKVTKNIGGDIEDISFEGSILSLVNERTLKLSLEAFARIRDRNFIRDSGIVSKLILQTQGSLLRLKRYYRTRNIRIALGIEEAGYILNAV